MKFWKNHEDIIKKAAVLTAVVFGVFFLMNKDAVIQSVSKKTDSENITSVFKKGENSAEEPETAVQAEEVPETVVPQENVFEEIEKKQWEEPAADDLRIHGFPYIELTSQLEMGDYVDVRIAFSDGTDYILLSKKQIQGLAPLREGGESAVWMIVSEEEIQRLSRAEADVCLNQGSRIYAIEYLSEKQKAADVNYTVSGFTKQSIEEDSREVYPEQEEIIYLD